jgi:predicted short-subunit dehydrogenase-like oxidoreductase (DUF2520 family)
MTPQKVGIVGTGRLGLSLALALGDTVAWIVGRSEQGRQRAGEILQESCIYADIKLVSAPAEYVVLAVSDTALAGVAEQCAAHWQEQLAGRVVLHCSGALDRKILETCALVGAGTPVVHPYQTFAAPSAGIFRGIAWGVEALPEERAAAVEFVEHLGGKPFLLSESTLGHKPLYHASAVIASNYLTMLVSLAADAATTAGISPGDFLPAIMRTTLENSLAAIKEENRIFPLTGPVARADIATITSHLQHLRPHAHLLRAYCRLGIATTELAGRRGILDEQQQQRILDLFIRELGENHDYP